MYFWGIFIIIIKKLKDYLQLEKQLIANNKEAVKHDLDRLLYIILPVCFFLFSFLVIFSLYTKPGIEVTIMYAIGAFISSISFIIVKKTESYITHLITYYLATTYIFLFFTYIGTFLIPDALATSVVVLLALLPLLIPDNFFRLNGFIFAYFIIYCFTTLYVKPFPVALNDIINLFCFTTIGFILGNNYRHIKLISFDVQRESKENEHIDFLTKLPNRRLMYLKIKENENSHSINNITGVMMMDIDFFKLYNDTKGHIEGDICLKNISRLFLKIAKEKQIDIYRYGGEEFVAFYYGLDEEKLDNLAYYIVDEVRNLKINFPETSTQFVTISLGYTYSHPKENSGINYLIDISDKALYLAKNSGRDCVKKI